MQPDPAGLTASLVGPVAEANAVFLEAAERVATAHGLTPARWQVLAASSPEPRSVAAIAASLGLARQSVQRVADDLAAAGLADWRENPAHRRAKLLVPSAEGEERIAAAQSDQLAWAEAVGAVLGPRKAGAAAALLTQLSLASERYWDRREVTA